MFLSLTTVESKRGIRFKTKLYHVSNLVDYFASFYKTRFIGDSGRFKSRILLINFQFYSLKKTRN